MTDKSIEADAARFRWLLDGNGQFFWGEGLCTGPTANEDEKDRARAVIDNEMRTPPSAGEVASILRAVTDLASRLICMHENTYRGGAIWEICPDCGAKWADDEGGRPADAGKVPAELAAAYDIIARLSR